MPSTLAIVGRPNVGKSTLFNRLLRRRTAITHDQPGVTRDRIVAQAVIEERPVILVDTGGLEITREGATEPDPIRQGIYAQARVAVEDADAVLLLMDGREGLTPLDEEVAGFIRKSGKPVLLVINKVDGPELEHTLLPEFMGLGFPLMAVSAEHGFNLAELRERVAEDLLGALPGADEPAEPEIEPGLRLAVLGRPNAGKSSLINAFSGQQRLLVSDVAGTTRDAVDVTFELDGERYTFVDTAGVRRKARIDDSLERFSVVRALAASKRAQVSLLVLDAEEGVTTQDKKLLAYLDKEKVPFLVLVNKIDLVARDQRPRFVRELTEELRMASHLPVVAVSARTRAGLDKVLPLARDLWRECQIRVGTGELNRALRTSIERHQPPLVKSRRAKFYYLTQVETEPPTFIFFVNDPNRVKPSYGRYLENQLRRMFGIAHAPIRVIYRSSHGEKKD